MAAKIAKNGKIFRRRLLDTCSDAELVEALQRRCERNVAGLEKFLLDGLRASKSGNLAALAEAALLVTKKGEDYNTGIGRDDYFPMGLASYAQMLHVKSLRLVALAKTPRGLNFESARDTTLDLINYASFAADWLGREELRARK